MTDDGRGPLPSKLYFRIGEVAGLVGVEPHVLRYWEREFRSIRPTKSAKGQRVYSRRDVENLLRVRELLYGQGFTIAGAKKRMRDRGAELDGHPDADLEPLQEATPEPAGAAAVDGAAPASTANGSSRGVSDAADSDRIRLQLEDLKTEIEAFLEELGA
jgi:DNA-binding transcriptional MerR regulator